MDKPITSGIDSDDVSQDVRDDLYRQKMETSIENQYTSCCSPRKTDKRLLLFSAQLGVSVVVLLFSSSMIAMKSENPIHVSIISSVLSFWLGKDPPSS